MQTPALNLDSLAAAYRQGLQPADLFAELLTLARADQHHAWISLISDAQLAALLARLAGQSPDTLPLFGVPFAIKDNIDWDMLPTTAACPAFAYTPSQSASVVQLLLAAGAIPLGKTNMDQFATGLNGTRSPYGICLNAFDKTRIAGGSSSGSAVAVARGQVSFALGTDTAGSGRVPAAFNELVGLKPTCGTVSTQGLVPACRSLDAVSLFALCATDAQRIWEIVAQPDPHDTYSRPRQAHGFDFAAAGSYRLGILPVAQRRFAPDSGYAECYDAALEAARQQGAQCVEIDYTPFADAARLLYEGPWVAERLHAIRDFITAQPDALFPVTRDITLSGQAHTAVDTFAALYRLRALKQQADQVWQNVDAILLPTVSRHPTVSDMLADPIQLNSELGVYTNFMNLLDYSAIAVPAGRTAQGLPFGVTCFAPAHQDIPLLHWAAAWERAMPHTLGAQGAVELPPTLPADPLLTAPASGRVRVAVCGAHLSGQPLNWQLTQRDAHRVACTHTAPVYQLFALAPDPTGRLPRRPGLVKTPQGGCAIEVEVWELPEAQFGSFVAGIPAPLGIGKTVLANGLSVPGFICEPDGLLGASNISALGGWRAWLATQTP